MSASTSTSTSNATLKQAKRLLEFFDEVGATTDQVQQFLGAGDLVKQMILSNLSQVDREAFASLMESADPTNGTFPDWYVGPEQQWANVRHWNEERHWGFIKADFPLIPDGLAPSSPLCPPVLGVYLPDKDGVPGYIRTLRELCRVAGIYISPNLILDADHLRLLPGTEEAHEPGIRWVMPDLGAHWNGTDKVLPIDVRGVNSAHAEAPAAAAHFPEWVMAMDGSNVPGVWLPGYQYWSSIDGYWGSVLHLDWSFMDSTARLMFSRENTPSSGFAVPERRPLPMG